MYENYGFVLNWDELDEDLREAKINTFIEKAYMDGEYNNEKGESQHELDWYLEDKETRDSAERHIEAYFPMYF